MCIVLRIQPSHLLVALLLLLKDGKKLHKLMMAGPKSGKVSSPSVVVTHIGLWVESNLGSNFLH